MNEKTEIENSETQQCSIDTETNENFSNFTNSIYSSDEEIAKENNNLNHKSEEENEINQDLSTTIININSINLQLKRKILRNKFSYILISLAIGIFSLSDLAIQYHFKEDLQIEPSKVAKLNSFILIPWTLKPLLGLLSDLVPLFGFKRKLYILTCGVFNIFAWIMLIYYANSLETTFAALFILNLTLSFSSVLGEAIVVEIASLSMLQNFYNKKLNGSDVNKKEIEIIDREGYDSAKNLVSYFFLFKNFGSLIAAIFKGPLMAYYSIETVFKVTSITSLLIFTSGLVLHETNIFKDKENLNSNYKTNANANKDKIDKKSLDNEENESKYNLLKEFYSFLSKKYIIISAAFMILFSSTPSYNDAFFFFITDELKITKLQLSINSIFTIISVLIGILAYRYYFKKFSFKSMITIGILLSFLFSFLAYYQVKRFNLLLHIPDFILIIFTSSITYLIYEIFSMPLVSLAAILCPKNLEATGFSIFMAAINLGSILSGIFGSLLIDYFNISKNDYSNLSSLILVCNVLTLFPLLILFFINKKNFHPQDNDSSSNTIKNHNMTEMISVEKCSNKLNDYSNEEIPIDLTD